MDRKLIVRADDFDSARAANAAILEAVRAGYLVRNVSCMAPGPYLDEGADALVALAHRVDIGLHLTVNAEWDAIKWAPCAPPEKIPALLNEKGEFYPSGEELPSYAAKLFGLSTRREDTCIGGFSMGGFGAIHTALAYPERFGRAAAFSAALIQGQVAAMTPETQDPIANYAYYRHTFGEPAGLPESSRNPEYLVKKQLAEGKTLPRLFFCVGTEDFLCQKNRQFRDFLTEQKVDFRYAEAPGIHDFRFVRSQLENAMEFLTEE